MMSDENTAPLPLEGGGWGEGFVQPLSSAERTPPPNPLPQGEGENYSLNQTVLILTPIKDAVRFLDSYFAGLARLTYPRRQISLGMLESDSEDDSYARFASRLADLSAQYHSTNIWRRDFGFRIPFGLPRWHHAFQLPRRKVLAKARNHLLFHALDEQDWVLWLDVDIVDYPPDLIERLLATGRDIVHPHCVVQPGGATFDRNGWRDNGRILLEDLRDGPDLVRLDSVGGTVLLVRADLHRDGLIFPSFPYGAASRAARRPHPLGPNVNGEIETEGLGIMAIDMGHQCWGMPNLEVLHAHDDPTPAPNAPEDSAAFRGQSQIRLLSCVFEIETNAPAVRDAFDALALRAVQEVPIHHRETRSVTWTGDAFRMEGDGTEDFELDVTNVVDSLYRRLHDHAVALLADHGFVAAACGWSEAEHFLVLGATGAGKTTLAVRLMLDGFAFSGDAWALLRDRQAIAWPQNFILGEDSVPLLPQLADIERFRAIAAQPRAGYRVSLDPVELGRPWRIAAAPVGAIFDLEPNFGARTVIRPCGKVEMVRRVMARSLAPAVRHDTWLADLCAMVDRAATYVVELGDLDSAAAEIARRLPGAGQVQA